LRSRRRGARREVAELHLVLGFDHFAVVDAFGLGVRLGFGLDGLLVDRQELQLVVQRFAQRAGFRWCVELQLVDQPVVDPERQRGERLEQRPVELQLLVPAVVFVRGELAGGKRIGRRVRLDREEAIK